MGRLMNTGIYYSLTEAAQQAQVSEEELRCAIEDGLLVAQRLPDGKGFRISREDLVAFLKATNHPVPLDDEIRRVLIVDDEINFGNLLKLDLTRDRRIQAKFASWGRDAVLLARQFTPDLVLLDFMLPDITAEEVLQGMRHLKERKGTKVLVYSAHTRSAIEANPNLRERLIQMGADDFMDKSIGLRAMTKVVYGLLGLDAATRLLKGRPFNPTGF